MSWLSAIRWERPDVQGNPKHMTWQDVLQALNAVEGDLQRLHVESLYQTHGATGGTMTCVVDIGPGDRAYLRSVESEPGLAAIAERAAAIIATAKYGYTWELMVATIKLTFETSDSMGTATRASGPSWGDSGGNQGGGWGDPF